MAGITIFKFQHEAPSRCAITTFLLWRTTTHQNPFRLQENQNAIGWKIYLH